MFMRANFVHIYLQGMRDRSMRSGTELVREIQLTDWSTAVQILHDICTCLKRYLYSSKCSWIISSCNVISVVWVTVSNVSSCSVLLNKIACHFLKKCKTNKILSHPLGNKKMLARKKFKKKCKEGVIQYYRWRRVAVFEVLPENRNLEFSCNPW